MKHLKKYNENKTETIDNEYIKDCFLEFFDNGQADEDEVYIEDDFSEYGISVNLPRISYKDGGWKLNIDKTIEDRIKYSQELLDFYNDVEYGVEKVKSRYPNVEITFDVEKEKIDSYTDDLTEAYIVLNFVKK